MWNFKLPLIVLWALNDNGSGQTVKLHFAVAEDNKAIWRSSGWIRSLLRRSKRWVYPAESAAGDVGRWSAGSTVRHPSSCKCILSHCRALGIIPSPNINLNRCSASVDFDSSVWTLTTPNCAQSLSQAAPRWVQSQAWLGILNEGAHFVLTSTGDGSIWAAVMTVMWLFLCN